MSVEIIPCSVPTKPNLTKIHSRYFGIKRGTAGRRGYPIRAIVLHCLGTSLTDYDNAACPSCKTETPTCHASMHYAIDKDGILRQYVDDANIAWGVQSYPGNFPTTTPTPNPQNPTVYPGWAWTQVEYPNVPLDMYVLHVGIAIPVGIDRGVTCGCERTAGLSALGYDRLVQLLAALCEIHDIPIDGNHIAFHEEIETPVNCPSEKCPCIEDHDLINDVDLYCERCSTYRDSSFSHSDTITWIYGENEFGCKVRIHIDDLKNLLSS